MRSTTAPRPALEALDELIVEARSLANQAARSDLSFLERGAINERLAEIREQLHKLPVDAPAIRSSAEEPAPDTVPSTEDIVTQAETQPPVTLSVATAPEASRRGRFIRMILLGLLLLALGFGAGFAWMVGSRIMRAQQTASQSVQRINQMNNAMSENGGEAVDSLAAFQGGCEDAGALERDLKPITDLAAAAGGSSESLARVPGVGDRAASMVTMAQAAQEIAGALRTTCDAIGPIGGESAVDGGASGVASAVLARLASHRSELRAAAAHVTHAQSQLQSIDESTLDESPRRILMSMRDRLGPAAARLALLSDAPGILGVGSSRSYLVLGQNSDELRPSGGFIGTSGVVTLEGGHVTHSEYGSSFVQALPSSVRVPPPAPLERYMAARYWQFWESNWWPDFPSSARQAEYFFKAAGNEHVDGVIAVNERITRNLLRVTGPVEVPDFGETVNADTVQDRLDFHVHEANYADPIRKKFVTSLFGAVMERLNSLPQDRLSALSAALSDGFRDQDLMMWTSDPDVNGVLTQLGWDGGMLGYRSDYLEVVSANLSANKVNRDIRQRLDYRVQANDDGRLTATVTMDLANSHVGSDPGQFRTADYRDYLRIYAPTGSVLIQSDGFEESTETLNECGRTAFGGFVTVTPEQLRTIRLTYILPASLQTADYSLVLQKQPGVKVFPVQVEILGAAAQQIELGQAMNVSTTGATPIRFGATTASDSVGDRVQCAVHSEPPVRVAAPRQLSIPRIGVNASVVELGVDASGTLEAPEDGKTVGWYPMSARPGQGGNMVVAGHLDWDRAQAVFWDLGKLSSGDRVSITAEDGSQHAYAVEWMRHYDAKDPPLNQILGPTTDKWLTLITCGGQFDRQSREYLERVVVRAQLVS